MKIFRVLLAAAGFSGPIASAQSTAPPRDFAVEVTTVAVGSALSPDIHVLLRHNGGKIESFRLRIEEGEKCSAPLRALSWRDPRITTEVTLTLPPTSWYALSIPTGFGLKKSLADCTFNAVVSAAKGEHWQPILQQSGKLLFQKPIFGSRRERGQFSVQSNVVVEAFSHGQLGLPKSVTFLNFQIFVKNLSQERRIVSIRKRTMACKSGDYDWALGVHEALSGLAAGPVELDPGAWTVFSQRAIVDSAHANCSGSFDVAELLAASENLDARWATVARAEATDSSAIIAAY